MAENMTVDNATIITDETQTAIKALAASTDSLRERLEDISTPLDKIVHMLTQNLGQQDFFETINLIANIEWTLDYHGRRFALIFTPTALASVGVRMYGVTGTVTFPAGWALLNDPERTVFTPPTGMSQIVVMKYTNFYSGSGA